MTSYALDMPVPMWYKYSQSRLPLVVTPWDRPKSFALILLMAESHGGPRAVVSLWTLGIGHLMTYTRYQPCPKKYTDHAARQRAYRERGKKLVREFMREWASERDPVTLKLFEPTVTPKVFEPGRDDEE